MAIKRTGVAIAACEAAGWNPQEISQEQYIALLERTLEEVGEFLEHSDAYIRKNLAKLDDAGVRTLRKRLAFPEGTLAVLPQETDYVIHLRGLNAQQRARLVKSLDRHVVATSDSGIPRVGSDGLIETDSVEPSDHLPAIDQLIERTAREVERRQSNPQDVGGKTNLTWRLT